jgi:hypothetical protein
MNLKFAVVIAIGLASVKQANAQRVAEIGVSRQAARESLNADSTRVTSSNDANTMARFVSSAMLATGGAFIAATVGASMEGPCGCDDPGLEGALLGALTGMTFGATIGAAAPTLGSVCSFGERFGRSFVGSLAGTAVGIVAAMSLRTGIGFFAIPVGAAGGSVVSLGRCLTSRGG